MKTLAALCVVAGFWLLGLSLLAGVAGWTGGALAFATCALPCWTVALLYVFGHNPSRPPPTSPSADPSDRVWNARVVVNGKRTTVQVTAPTEELAIRELIRSYKTLMIHDIQPQP